MIQRFYRCRCGKTTMFGSKAPDLCDSCLLCGSDIAEGPDGHKEPLPHDFSMIGTVERCRYCRRTKAEIEKFTL